jgi:ankyrin repeat protein
MAEPVDARRSPSAVAVFFGEWRRILRNGTFGACVSLLALLVPALLAYAAGLTWFRLNLYAQSSVVIFLLGLPQVAFAAALWLSGPIAACGLAALGERASPGRVIALALARSWRLFVPSYALLALPTVVVLVQSALFRYHRSRMVATVVAAIALVVTCWLFARYVMVTSVALVVEGKRSLRDWIERASELRIGKTGRIAAALVPVAFVLGVALLGENGALSAFSRAALAIGLFFLAPLAAASLASAGYALALPDAPADLSEELFPAAAPRPARSLRAQLALIAPVLLLVPFFLMSRDQLLIRAAQKGLHPAVVALRMAGARVRGAPGEALLDSVARGSAGEVRTLLAARENPNALGSDRRSALMLAGHRGHGETVRALIEGGADVRWKDESGRTALHEAAAAGSLQSVEALLAAGAEPDARTSSGQTPLLAALVPRPSPRSDGIPQVLRAFLDAGADPNARDAEGDAPLFLAVQSAGDEAVRALLTAGADVNGRTNLGETALMAAAWRGRVETTRILLSAGADVLARTSSGWTALDSARKRGSAEIETMLVEAAKR